jgi:hypothetical protein
MAADKMLRQLFGDDPVAIEAGRREVLAEIGKPAHVLAATYKDVTNEPQDGGMRSPSRCEK